MRRRSTPAPRATSTTSGGRRAALRGRAARLLPHPPRRPPRRHQTPATSPTWTPSRRPSRTSPTSSSPPATPSRPPARVVPPTPSGRRRRRAAHGRWPGTGPAATHQVGPVDQEDHQGDGAHRRQPHREGAAARRRGPALQRADHRGDPQPGRRRRRRRLAAAAAARAGRHGRRTSSWPPTGAWRRLQHRRASAPPSGPWPADRADGQQTTARHRRQEGRRLLPLPRLRRSTPVVHRVHRRARPTRTPARSAARGRRAASRPARYDQVELVYTRFISPASSRSSQRRFVPLDDRGRRRDAAAATERRPDGRLRVRARARTRSSTACCPATPRPGSSPPCSRPPPPSYAARQRAMKSRHRQRRRADHQASAGS